MIALTLTLALLAQDETAYEKAVESTVRLRVLDAKGRTSVATGVVVGDGRVLTAYHAVKGATKITADAPIRLDGSVVADPKGYGPGIACTLVSHSPGRDLALLKAAGVGPPLKLAAKSSSPGAAVFSIGNGNVMFRYAGGCVRQAYFERVSGIQGRMIECALANSVGDSGGPVVNRAGELAGIVCYGDVQAIRAVDVAEVREFLKGAGQ